jgi:2-haloacid dehalogenase
MKYELVLMDLDNTLLDFNLAQTECYLKTMEKFGLPNAPHNLEHFKKCNHKVWDAFERNECSKQDALLNRFKLHLDEDCDATALNDVFLEYLAGPPKYLKGARELVNYCMEESTVEIVTNGDSKTQNSRITKSEFKFLQNNLTISDDLGIAKPDPRIFLHAIEKHGFTKNSKIVMIGDNLNADIKGAQDLGIDTIWINPNQLKTDLPTTPTYSVHDPIEALHVLKQ